MEAKVMERPRGLTDRQKDELRRNTLKEVLSNRINIAQGSEDPSDIKEEIVSIVRHYGLTKRMVVAMFDGQGSMAEFVQGLDIN